jgi:AcrR family transcriptional regulator
MASQRGRMLDAMAQVVAEKGYGSATVADVIERAGVSRKTFYEHFRDKEACFLAAFDTGVEIILSTVRDADPGGDDPLERVRARVRTYLQTLEAEPAFARTFVIEVGAAGPRALQRRHEVLGEFAASARELAEEWGFAGVPDAAYLASVGATNELVAAALVEGRPLTELEDAIVYVNAALLVPR